MTTPAHLPVPLPAGATCSDEWWHDPAEHRLAYRVIGSDWHAIKSVDQVVSEIRTSALQFTDGTIDSGEVEAPVIFIEGGTDSGITSARARCWPGRSSPLPMRSTGGACDDHHVDRS